MKKSVAIIFAIPLLVILGCTPRNSKKVDVKESVVETKSPVKNSKYIDIDDSMAPGQMPIANIEIGKISEGEIISVPLTIKNSTDLPLIIFNVTASCGCTSVEYDKSPVMTDKERRLTVEYDSKGKIGMQFVDVKLVTDRGDYNIRLTIYVDK